MMLAFGRGIKFAFQDIARNVSLSLMTVFILVLMLLSINTLIVLRILTHEATTLVKNQIDVSIFFSHDASEKQIAEVRDYVGKFPEVRETVFQTSDEVLAEFKAEHADNVEIVASVDELGANPFGPTLIVRTKEPRDYQKIIDALKVPEYEHIIEAKTFGDSEAAIERIDTITRQVERFTVGLTVLFGLIAFLIIFNTIRVAIFTHRTEISIKKLVGASNWFVRGPYLVEAFVFTCVSLCISAVLVGFSLRGLDPYVDVVFGSKSLLTNYFQTHILLLLGIQFGAVLVLTFAASLLATRRYLRV